MYEPHRISPRMGIAVLIRFTRMPSKVYVFFVLVP